MIAGYIWIGEMHMDLLNSSCAVEWVSFFFAQKESLLSFRNPTYIFESQSRKKKAPVRNIIISKHQLLGYTPSPVSAVSFSDGNFQP